jgi:hypothetical protein
VRACDDGYMTDSTTRYLSDLVADLWSEAADAHSQAAVARSSGSDEAVFLSGRALGLYEAVSTMHNKAIAFNLDMESIGLAERTPDDLLGGNHA